jgi:hypothetical protein
LTELRRDIEKTLQERVAERVEKAVARELAPESNYVRRLGEQLQASLYESLLFEKERLGWD